MSQVRRNCSLCLVNEPSFQTCMKRNFSFISTSSIYLLSTNLSIDLLSQRNFCDDCIKLLEMLNRFMENFILKTYYFTTHFQYIPLAFSCGVVERFKPLFLHNKATSKHISPYVATKVTDAMDHRLSYEIISSNAADENHLSRIWLDGMHGQVDPTDYFHRKTQQNNPNILSTAIRPDYSKSKLGQLFPCMARSDQYTCFEQKSALPLYECWFCTTSFINRQDLKSHIKCHSNTVPDPLGAHLVVHAIEQKPFSCSICNKSFHQKRLLDGHFATHSVQKPYSCNACGKSFTLKKYLKNHSVIHSERTLYPCSVCHHSYCSKYSLKLHLVSHAEQKPFSCNICSKSFNQKRHLKDHLFKHSDRKPYVCEQCGKPFSTMTNLRRHYVTHSQKPVQFCSICNKRFTWTASLKRHLQSHYSTIVRPQPSPCLCSVCEKPFKDRKSFRAHFVRHSNRRMFPCTLCDRSFNDSSTLKGHLVTHSELTPYRCCICDKSFRRWGNLKTHLTIHSERRPYSCTQCHKKFKLKGYLTSHASLHCQLKLHSCKLCNKSFIQKRYLASHLKIHLQQKPHVCTSCNKSFGYKKSLLYHLKVVHNSE